MFRVLRPSAHQRRGAALVEAALVLPIFFMVVLGIIEFGRAFMVCQVLQNAAREGCRKAVTGAYTTAAISTDIKNDLKAVGVNSAKVTVSIIVTVDPTNPAVANNEVSLATTKDLVAVTVSIPFKDVQLIPGKYLGANTLTGKSSMRHE
ncbi:MAG: TadE/TadG family type IV pilus assembly protein [Planctomycetota bacterium]